MRWILTLALALSACSATEDADEVSAEAAVERAVKPLEARITALHEEVTSANRRIEALELQSRLRGDVLPVRPARAPQPRDAYEDAIEHVGRKEIERRVEGLETNARLESYRDR